MDIRFLIFLQELRESLPVAFTQLFMLVSDFVVGPGLVAIPCVVYWCLDKRRGVHVLFSFVLGAFVNNLIKICACVPRPWMRSEQVRPYEPALETATGYSFPSGHTQSATTIFGALAWSYRHELVWALPASVCIVALVAFSRTLLGVHAPQDVLAGAALGVGCIWIADKLVTWAEQEEGRDGVMAVTACAMSAAACVLIAFKPYPALGTGTETVAAEMALDSYKAVGAFLGAFLGWWAERRFVGFEAPCEVRQGVVRVLVGIVVVAVFRYALALPFAMAGDAPFEFVKNFLTTVAAVVAAPWAFVRVESPQQGRS